MILLIDFILFQKIVQFKRISILNKKDKTSALKRHHRERLMHSRSHDTFSGTTEQQHLNI